MNPGRSRTQNLCSYGNVIGLWRRDWTCDVDIARIRFVANANRCLDLESLDQANGVRSVVAVIHRQERIDTVDFTAGSGLERNVYVHIRFVKSPTRCLIAEIEGVAVLLDLVAARCLRVDMVALRQTRREYESAPSYSVGFPHLLKQPQLCLASGSNWRAWRCSLFSLTARRRRAVGAPSYGMAKVDTALPLARIDYLDLPVVGVGNIKQSGCRASNSPPGSPENLRLGTVDIFRLTGSGESFNTMAHQINYFLFCGRSCCPLRTISCP